LLSGQGQSGAVTLDWTSVSGATSYGVHRSIGGAGSFATLNPNVTATIFQDTGLTNGVPYDYYVAAVDAAGQGVTSNIVQVVPGGVGLPAPIGLSATAGSASISLSWNAAAGAVSYNIYRATSAGGEGSVPYVVQCTSPSYTDGAVNTTRTYYYLVTAVDSVGESASSNEASARPGAAQLPAPTLTGRSGAAQAVLTWSTIGGATSYNVYRSVDGGVTFTAAYTGLTKLTVTDTGLTNGVPYAYYVCAVNSSGMGLRRALAADGTGGLV